MESTLRQFNEKAVLLQLLKHLFNMPDVLILSLIKDKNVIYIYNVDNVH